MWSQPILGGVSIGRAWGEIWANGVWANGVWANIPAPSPTLIPLTLYGNFEWVPIGGTVVSVLQDPDDGDYVISSDTGAAFQVTLTPSPYATITAATLKIRMKKA